MRARSPTHKPNPNSGCCEFDECEVVGVVPAHLLERIAALAKACHAPVDQPGVGAAENLRADAKLPKPD